MSYGCEGGDDGALYVVLVHGLESDADEEEVVLQVEAHPVEQDEHLDLGVRGDEGGGRAGAVEVVPLDGLAQLALDLGQEAVGVVLSVVGQLGIVRVDLLELCERYVC